MKKQTAKQPTIITICLLVSAIATLAIWKSKTEAQVSSARLALCAQIHTQLAGYFKDHGRYPNTLDELTITNFPDGATKRTLELFAYSADGKTFSLVCP